MTSRERAVSYLVGTLLNNEPFTGRDADGFSDRSSPRRRFTRQEAERTVENLLGSSNTPDFVIAVADKTKTVRSLNKLISDERGVLFVAP